MRVAISPAADAVAGLASSDRRQPPNANRRCCGMLQGHGTEAPRTERWMHASRVVVRFLRFPACTRGERPRPRFGGTAGSGGTENQARASRSIKRSQRRPGKDSNLSESTSSPSLVLRKPAHLVDLLTSRVD
jgi:hypothetical protein